MKKLYTILFATVLIIFSGLSFASALKESLTYDEVVDIQEGRNAVLSHTFDIDPYNPPLTRELGIAPYLVTRKFYLDPNFPMMYPIAGRLVMIGIGVLLLSSLWIFTKKYIGEKEALFAVSLLALEPTILANSHYLTMDIGLTLFLFVAYWCFLQVMQKVTLKNTLLLGLSIGLGIVAKISFIPYFFISTFLLIAAQYKGKVTKLLWSKKIFSIVVIIVVFFVIWGSYFFKETVVIKERQDVSRVSERILSYAQKHNNQVLRQVVLLGKNQPVPLGDFLATLKNNVLRTAQTPSCYFYGTFYSSCKWYFMIGNLLLKLPISLMILFFVSIFYLVGSKKKRKIALQLLIPIAVILFVASASRMSPMVRYVLPMYPFMVIIASMGLGFWLKTFWRKIIFAILLLWYLSAAILAFPHFISYANELAGPKNNRGFVLIDSNIDWGQSLPDVSQYHKQHSHVQIHLSFSGRDNGNTYGLISDKAYGSYKEQDICEFHTIGKASQQDIIFISITNWYLCGYSKEKQYTKQHIKVQLSDSFFIF